MNILIISRNKEEHEEYKNIIASSPRVINISIFTANTIKNAITFLEKTDFDCILLDYAMPDNAALAFLEYFNLHFSTSASSIIFLTEKCNNQIITYMSKYGILDYIIKKPINKDALISTILHGAKDRQLILERSESDERFRLLYELSPNLLLLVVNEKIAFINSAGKRLFNEAPDLPLIGQKFINFIHVDDKNTIASFLNNREYIPGQSHIHEVSITVDTKIIHMELIGAPVIYLGKPATQIIGYDIRKTSHIESNLLSKEVHDETTDIPNEYKFNEFLKFHFAQAKHKREMISLIICDIDNFEKYISDLGKERANETLKSVAEELKNCISRNNDLIARISDRFLLLLPQTDKAGAMTIANQIQKTITKAKIPFFENNDLTVCTGLTSFRPNIEANECDLIEIADNALYKAKNQGPGNTIFFGQTK